MSDPLNNHENHDNANSRQMENEQDLWNVLSGDSKPEPKPAPAVKTGPKFASDKPPKGRVDGFFLACMAGVAAVSVAATLVIGGMLGGEKPPTVSDPVSTNAPAATGDSDQLAALERENAELRAQLEQQKQQVKDLQADLLELLGSEEYLATVPSNPEQSNENLDAQVEAYEIFAQIQEAYANFDRAALEELIPEMDKRLSYLSSEALNNYYMILEYVEQPSNG